MNNYKEAINVGKNFLQSIITPRQITSNDKCSRTQRNGNVIYVPSLIEAFRHVGIAYPDKDPRPGEFIRFSTDGSSSDKAGWCMVFTDQEGAIFGDWRSSVEYVWQRERKGPPLDALKLAAIRKRAEEKRQAGEIERQAAYAEAAKKAAAIWQTAQPVSDYDYLKSKRIGPHIAREHSNRLIVPVYSNDGLIQSLQIIYQDGKKLFLRDGKMQGGRCWIGEPDTTKPILITEGFATAASLHEATGWPVCIAFTAGNLKRVASDVRKQFPNTSIVICGDDDRHREMNVGRTKAIEAANAIDSIALFPTFINDAGTDFNDMAVEAGLEAVRTLVVNGLPTLSSDIDPESEPWSDPLPIPNTLLPVIPFDDALLPKSIRNWVSDISERMQCPPDFVAAGAMVAISSVISRKACIAPKRYDDWRVIPNLWGVIVGRPGVKKSPALSATMQPIGRLAAMANKQYAKEMSDYSVTAELNELVEKVTKTEAQKLIRTGNTEEAAQLLSAHAEQKKSPPALRRYKVTDSTVEALGEILMENPWGVLCYRDELYGLLCSLDKSGQEGSRSFYLQAYDGNQGYTIDRITRGRNLHIPALCVAMLGGIQPGKLQSYIHEAIKGGAGDDGLLQRFGLLVWPDIDPVYRNIDRKANADAFNEAFETFKRLDALTGGTDVETGETAPVEYRFTEAAQVEFDAWQHDFETSLRTSEQQPAMESHLSKYRKLVPALALVCALTDGEEIVSHDSLLRALAWAEYLQSHAMRAYAAGTQIQTVNAKALLDKIMCGKLSDGFTQRDVYLKNWSMLTSKDEVLRATDMLCDLGYLRMIEQARRAAGGRPSFRFEINPTIRTERDDT